MRGLKLFSLFIKVCLGLERSQYPTFFLKGSSLLAGRWGIFSWSWLTEDSCLPVLQLCSEVPWDFACSRVNTFVRRQHLVPVIERQGFASLSPTIFQGKEARLRQTRLAHHPSKLKEEVTLRWCGVVLRAGCSCALLQDWWWAELTEYRGIHFVLWEKRGAQAVLVNLHFY